MLTSTHQLSPSRTRMASSGGHSLAPEYRDQDNGRTRALPAQPMIVTEPHTRSLPRCLVPWQRLIIFPEGVATCCLMSRDITLQHVSDGVTHLERGFALEQAWNCARMRQVRQGIVNGSFEGCGADSICRVVSDPAARLSLLEEPSPSGEKAYQDNIRLYRESITQGHTTVDCKPRHLEVVLTHRCNLSCIMCWQKEKTWSRPPEHLAAIATLYPYLDLLHLIGGEVFALPHLKDIVAETTAYPQLKIAATTNGTLVDDEIAAWIDHKFAHLYVSIDGAGKRVYERIRRGASFDQLLENLRRLAATRTRKTIIFVVNRLNHAEIPQIVRLAHEYRIEAVTYSRLHSQAQMDEETRALLDIPLDDHGLLQAVQHGLDAAERLGRELGVAVNTSAPRNHYKFNCQ